jgi:hypothetical protein
LKVMIGSDITHFDVPDFAHVLGDAHSLVRKGLIDAEQFKKFTFSNIAEMLQRADPTFFQGTAVERETGRLELSIAR